MFKMLLHLSTAKTWYKNNDRWIKEKDINCYHVQTVLKMKCDVIIISEECEMIYDRWAKQLSSSQDELKN